MNIRNLSIEKAKTVVIVVLACVIAFGGSFFASELSYYQSHCEISSSDEDESFDGYDFHNIGVLDYLSLLNGDELSFIYIGQINCAYSTSQKSEVQKLIDNYHITVHYLELDQLSRSEYDQLVASYSAFQENGIGTPTLLLVQNGEVKMFERGYQSYEALLEQFQQYGFIK